MKTRKLAAVASDGTILTRTTHRDYTHVVVVLGTAVLKQNEDHSPGGTGAYGWCGRYDLAAKRAEQARKFWTEVEIAEVIEG